MDQQETSTPDMSNRAENTSDLPLDSLASASRASADVARILLLDEQGMVASVSFNSAI